MTIIVCGAGTMGRGIAETSARSGYDTILFDLEENVLQHAKIIIEKSLQQQVISSRMNEDDKNATLQRIHFTNNISQCKGDIVIEAIVESPEPKIELFTTLALINDNKTIFASNTSSLSVSLIGNNIPHPERFCGMHFFNPPQVMKLVEVVEGEKTAPWVTEKISGLVKAMGKFPVSCKDSPGFIVNRVARHYYLEALKLAEEGIDLETTDRILESCGFKMGPFRLMDLIGNDINYAVTKSLYEACGKPLRFKPSSLQESKLNNGELGRKTGKGFYSY